MVLVPNRSTGNPLVALYREPPPGADPNAKSYKDAVTIPAGDIKQNSYFKRDHRRNYPRISSFDQTKISGLLTLGSKQASRVLIGNEGYKQLAVFDKGKHVYLSSVLKQVPDTVVNGQILGSNGEPVVAPSLNKGYSWDLVKGDHGMYTDEYPCRLFNTYKA